MAFEYQGFATLGVNLNRQKYGPLDISNVFISENDLKYYLTKGAYTEGVSKYWYESADKKVVPYPYEGQVLATVINGVVSVYALSVKEFEEDGVTPKTFKTQEIGAKIETDDKTIKLVDGKLELVGLPEVTTGKTFVPSLVNGILTWAEPDTSTADGQQQAIDGLTTRMITVEETLNGKPAIGEEGSEDYTPAVVGLVDKVAALEAVDNVTQENLEDYAESVTNAIAAAVAEAKEYADTQDSALTAEITSISSYVRSLDRALDDLDSKVNQALPNIAQHIGQVEDSIADLGDTVDGLSDTVDELSEITDGLHQRLSSAENTLNTLDYVTPSDLEAELEAVQRYVDEGLTALEDTIAGLNHFTAKVVTSVEEVTETGVLYLIKDESVNGADKYNEYILVDGIATLIGDTTTNLDGYATIEGVESYLEDTFSLWEGPIDQRLESVETSLQDHLEAFDAYQTEVTAAIQDVSDIATDYTDEVGSRKLDKETFEAFEETNTNAIVTAKEEAIVAAAAAEEAKGYAVDAEVKETYATKAELAAHAEDIANDLLGYTTNDKLAEELAKKADVSAVYTKDEVNAKIGVPGTPAVKDSEGNVTTEAVAGTGVYQYVYSKDEVTSLIADITGGESAADVLAALNAYKTTNDTRVKSVEDVNAAQTTAIETAQAQADKGVADAAQVGADLATANLLIADNTREIGVAKSSIETVNSTLTEKVTALENADTKFTSDIAAIQGIVSGEGGHASRISSLETRTTNLEAKDTELATLIQGNTDKFADYYTKSYIDQQIALLEETDIALGEQLNQTALKSDVDAALALKANAADVYTKAEADLAFMTEAEIDARINTLIAAADPDNDGNVIKNIENLVEYVENNAGEIAALISTVGDHTTAISKNATDIAGLVEALAAVVQPKASEEITVAADGTLGIGKVSTDKLELGEDVLVLDGGSAAN